MRTERIHSIHLSINHCQNYLFSFYFYFQEMSFLEIFELCHLCKTVSFYIIGRSHIKLVYSFTFVYPIGLLFSSNLISLSNFSPSLSCSALFPFGRLYLSNFGSLSLISSFLTFSPSGTLSWLGILVLGFF